MKDNTKKIAKYSLLAISASAILPMACKKEEADDPNIKNIVATISVIADIVGSNKYTPIDIDGNGVKDIGIASWYSNAGNLQRGSWIEADDGTGYSAEVLVNIVTGYKVTSFLNIDDDINSTKTTWNGDYGYVSQSTNVVTRGTADNIDRYIGIRFKISGNTHYGWMKIRTSNAGKTLTVSEMAYDIRPDTGIKVGAK